MLKFVDKFSSLQIELENLYKFGMFKWFFKLFSAFGGKFDRESRRIIEQINALEHDVKLLNEEQILQESGLLKKEAQLATDDNHQKIILDQLLPRAFALVREVAKRTLGQRHFDVQLMGGIALHQGKIAEMRTGEGKTLAATAPAYLNALAGKGVHIITVNE